MKLTNSYDSYLLNLVVPPTMVHGESLHYQTHTGDKEAALAWHACMKIKP